MASACGGKKSEDKAEEEPESAAPAEPECTTDDECPRNQVCYLEACVSTSSKRDIYSQRGKVTPAKVKREVERRTEERQKQLDRGLNMEE